MFTELSPGSTNTPNWVREAKARPIRTGLAYCYHQNEFSPRETDTEREKNDCTSVHEVTTHDRALRFQYGRSVPPTLLFAAANLSFAATDLKRKKKGCSSDPPTATATANGRPQTVRQIRTRRLRQTATTDCSFYLTTRTLPKLQRSACTN